MCGVSSSAAGAANPLTTCSQQQAISAREVNMPMTLATAFPFVLCAGLGSGPCALARALRSAGVMNRMGMRHSRGKEMGVLCGSA